MLIIDVNHGALDIAKEYIDLGHNVSVWDIYGKLEKDKDFLKNLDYINPKVNVENEIIEVKKDEIINALRLFKDSYEISSDEIQKHVYIYLVKRNILFLNPIEGTLKPQSYLIWYAIKEVL